MSHLAMEDQNLVEKMIGRQLVYQGNPYQLWLDELQLPNGSEISRMHLHHPGGVAVLALDDQNRCAMVRQYRHPISQVTLEIPAGKHAAHRELREETGFTAKKMISLGYIYPSPGIIDEVLHLFLAREIEKSSQDLDDDEFIQVSWLHMDELEEKIASGEIKDIKAICAFSRARLMKLI